MKLPYNQKTSKILAELIRYHRKQAHLSQADLAKLAGVGKTSVFDLEHQKANTRCDTLFKILNVLNISIVFEGPLIKTYEHEVTREKG